MPKQTQEQDLKMKKVQVLEKVQEQFYAFL